MSGPHRSPGQDWWPSSGTPQEHADVIERYRIPTLDFRADQPTRRRYSRAKVVDMIFFIEGGGSGLAA